MLVKIKTQYGGDVVMFLPNKIIINNRGFIVYSLGGPCTWFLLNHVQGLLNNPWFYYTWFMRTLQMVLRPCPRPPKQPMVVGGPCIWF